MANITKHSWPSPKWLEDPRAGSVIFHDQEVEVYSGKVNVNSIQLWRNNERTTLDIEHLAKESGVRDVKALTDDEIIAYVIKNGSHKIVQLAKSIKINGVRVPLTLTHKRELLDGNRRFIACKYLLDTERQTDPKFETVTVNCLKPNLSKSLRYKIISEMNFLPDHKEKWPQEVRARYIKTLFNEYKKKFGEERAVEEVTFLLDIKKIDIYRFIEVLHMIGEYKKFAGEKSKEAQKEAEIFARDKFHFFEEFYNKDIKKKDPSTNKKVLQENKGLFYDYLYNKHLVSTTGVRDFAFMLQYPSIKKIIKSKKESLDYAKSLYDDIAIPKRASLKIEKFCEWIEGLSKTDTRKIHPDVKAMLFKTIKKLDTK